jgi:hypothetical protein
VTIRLLPQEKQQHIVTCSRKNIRHSIERRMLKINRDWLFQTESEDAAKHQTIKTA